MVRSPDGPSREVLPANVAERLLARASELDTGSAQVADLRQAAVEAGISADAFDQALAEYQAEKSRVPAPPAVDHHGQVRRFSMVVAALVAMLVAAAVLAITGG